MHGVDIFRYGLDFETLNDLYTIVGILAKMKIKLDGLFAYGEMIKLVS